MNLNETSKIPTSELITHLKNFYPGKTIGVCRDYGGQADGAAIELSETVIANIHHDDGGFCHEGWTVETFDIETLDPDVFPCGNLGEALAKLNQIITNH